MLAKYYDKSCCLDIDGKIIFLNRYREENTIENMTNIVGNYMEKNNINGCVCDFREL